MPDQGFAEISFADGIAYVLHSPSPDALVTNLQAVAACLHEAAASRGLQVNYSTGKTEAMLRLAGKGF